MTGKSHMNDRIPRESEAPGDGASGTPEPSFRIRSPRPVDLSEVIGLVTAAALSPEGIADWFVEGYIAAERGERIVGCAGLETYGSHGLLRSVAVSPDCRGLGIGRALVVDRLEWARARGLSAVYLLTESAAAYFRRFGFDRISRAEVPPEIRASHEFAVMCPETADVMELRLSGR